MTKRQNTKLSIIICTYNREEFLPLALESILEQLISPNLFELLLIDNNSTDSTPEICSKFIAANKSINIRYFIETNQGLSHARNRGIKEAQGELLTFVDDDALIDKNFSKASINFFDTYPKINAAGGPILLHFLVDMPYWYNPFLASLLGYFNYGKKTFPLKKDYFRGSNMTFRKAIFNKHAAFNTELGRVGKNLAGSEEKEIFYRLKNAGEQIWYIGNATVYHLVPKERVGIEFIKKQGIGTGYSQRIMALISGNCSYLLILVKELAKWIVSIVLSIYYLVTLRPKISLVLLKFRYWVSSGLISKSV